jgi:hypothetical protein
MLVDLSVLGISAYHTVNYSPPALRALRSGASTGGQRIVVGMWLFWLVLLAQRGWVVVLSAAGRPESLSHSLVPTVIASGLFIAGFYLAAAPVSDNYELPKRETRMMLLATAFSFLIVGLVLGIYVVAPAAIGTDS